MRQLSNVIVYFLLLVATLGCQASLRNVSLLDSPQLSESKALNVAVEKYFRASTPQKMREAVEEAQQAGPSSGDYHFIAADLAHFDDRQLDRFDHLVEASRDVHSQFASLALRYLWYMEPGVGCP